MALYRITFKARAQKELRKLPQNISERVEKAIDELANNPRPRNSKKLINRDNSWRLRIGNYRVLYEIYDNEIKVLIVRIRHRRDVYE